MKKAILLLFIYFTITLGGIAQYVDNNHFNYVRTKPDSIPNGFNNFFSFGIGTGGYYPYYGGLSNKTPNFSFLYERNIFKHLMLGSISAGALFSYTGITSPFFDYNNGYVYSQQWNYYVIGTRITYHFNGVAVKGVEPYVGAMLGYYITRFHITTNDPNYNKPDDPGYYLTPNNYPSFFAPGIFAGIRLGCSTHLSTWFELGYGYSTASFGFCYKI